MMKNEIWAVDIIESGWIVTHKFTNFNVAKAFQLKYNSKNNEKTVPYMHASSPYKVSE